MPADQQPGFACMQFPWWQGPTTVYEQPEPRSLFQPPMKTWLEHVATELGCKEHELCLCHKWDDGVERWWWERIKIEA